MLLSTLALAGLIFTFELISSVESICIDGKAICLCGDSYATVSISCVDGEDVNPCKAYNHCETCEDDVTHCLTCPIGYSGPLCTSEDDFASWGDDSDAFHNDQTGSRLIPRDLTCPELKAPKLGSMRCWYSGNEKECTGKCLPGHSFERGIKEVKLSCQSGVWMPRSSFPACKSEGYCKIDIITAGFYNCTTGVRGTFCDITCNGRGYRPSFGSFSCYPGRSWDPPLPFCAKEAVNSEESWNDRTQSCECQNGGSCNSRNGECICPEGYQGAQCERKAYRTRPRCRRPPRIDNGAATNTDGSIITQNQQFYEGSSVVYSCHSDYGLTGRGFLTCTKQGVWSDLPPQCTPLHTSTTENTEVAVLAYCKDPGVDPNGIKAVSPWINLRNLNRNSNRQVEYPQGTEIGYSCREGYDLKGETTLRCLFSGSWSSSIPTCRAKPTTVTKSTETEDDLAYCKEPGVDPNGIKTVTVWIDPRTGNSDGSETQYPQGTKINYSCKDGYDLEGELAIVCLFSGYWSSPTPKCRAKPFASIREAYCENPGDVDNGWKTVSQFVDPRTNQNVFEDADDFPRGVRLIYYCNTGFSRKGSQIIKCEESGRWSSAKPTCQSETAKQLQGCGHSSYAVVEKILHGDRTVEGQWPWQVAYAENRRLGMTITCGAALISHNVVLTAAHCVLPRRLDKTFLYFGKFFSDFSKDDNGVLSAKATEFIVHPSYNRRNMDNDIAMVRFSPDVPYNTRIRPICLPAPDTTSQNIKSGVKGVVTGWGTTENGTDSDILLMAQLPVVTRVQCQNNYRRENLAIQISNNMYCAGSAEGGTDSCTGDSGGPMVFYNSLTQSYVVEGIVSFGVKGPTGSCGQVNRYGVYTKVSNYVTWIRQYI